MVISYDFKLIKSGKEIEVYKYRDKLISRGYKNKHNRRPKPKPKPKTASPYFVEIEKWDLFTYAKVNAKKEAERLALKEIKQHKTKFSISRTRTSIRRLVNANPHLCKFLTLTFAKSTTELSKANKIFNTAMKRIMRRLPGFEYIAIVEYQSDIDFFGRVKPDGGSVHYHLLCNIETPTKYQEVRDWEVWFDRRYWKHGFCCVKEVEKITNMGAYFCKYLGKDMTDTRMFGKKKYFCSQTLKKPIEMIRTEAIEFYEHHVSELEPVFERTFYSEYVGNIMYSAYTLPEEVELEP